MEEGLDPEARRPAKSSAAFRTISEVAQDLDVPQHVLRFWESKFTQVKPLKRGGGRRYYRPEDVALLRRIRQCLYQEGYTIKGVQRLLREGGLKGGPAAAEPGAADSEPNVASVEAAAPPPSAAAPARQPVHEAFGPDIRRVLEDVRRELIDLRDVLHRATS